MLKYNIVKPSTSRVSRMPMSKRSLKIAATNTAKWVRAEQKKSNSPEFVPPLGNESDSDIPS